MSVHFSVYVFRLANNKLDHIISYHVTLRIGGTSVSNHRVERYRINLAFGTTQDPDISTYKVKSTDGNITLTSILQTTAEWHR